MTDNTTFLKTGMFTLLQDFSETQTNKWGKMSAQQMLEHLRDFFMVSTGAIHFPLAVPQEHLPKYREFLWSDKEFRENTKAPTSVLGEEPLPLRFPSFNDAGIALKKSVDDFFKYYQDNNETTTLHPAFGELSYKEWVLLHNKHVRHHLRQFGIIE